jgi:hypothetical protein
MSILGLLMALSVSRLGQGQAREAGTESSGVSGISLSRAARSIAYALGRRRRGTMFFASEPLKNFAAQQNGERRVHRRQHDGLVRAETGKPSLFPSLASPPLKAMLGMKDPPKRKRPRVSSGQSHGTSQIVLPSLALSAAHGQCAGVRTSLGERGR